MLALKKNCECFFRNVDELFLHGLIPVFLTGVLITLSGCQCYSSSVLQQNLNKALSRRYIFQQIPETKVSPAQYHLCGDNCYPCRAYTSWVIPYFYRYDAKPLQYYRRYPVKHKKSAPVISPLKAQKPLEKQEKKQKDDLINDSIFLSPLKSFAQSRLSIQTKEYT